MQSLYGIRGGFQSQQQSTRFISTTSSGFQDAAAAHDVRTVETPQDSAMELPEANADESRVAIGWPDGTWSRLSALFLHCPERRNTKSQNRL